MMLTFNIFMTLFWLASAQQMSEPQPMTIPALGRPFVLGALYNQPANEIILGLALWDRNNMSAKTFEKDLPNVKTKIVSSERYDEVSSLFSISADINADLMSNRLHLEGSASFLTHKALSNYYASVSFVYMRRTHMRELTMEALTRPDYANVLDRKTGATHVVTGVEYGANAVFRLTKKIYKNEMVMKVHGKLKIGFKSGFGEITGGAELNLTNIDNDTRRNTVCEFMGDVSLPNPPITYDDAVMTYENLSDYINKSTAVPMMVYLTPLALIDSKANKLVRQISNYLLDQVMERMHLYNSLADSLEDVKETFAYKLLELFQEHVNSFSTGLDVHKAQFQKQLLVILPNIRGGGRTEEALAKVLDESEVLYPMNELARYLRWKLTESGALAETASAVPFALKTAPGSFERILFNDTIQYILSFTFFLYESIDNFTECLKNACKKDPAENVDSQFCSTAGCATNYSYYKSWTQDRTIPEKMTEAFSKFKRAAEYNKNMTGVRSGRRTAVAIRELAKTPGQLNSFAVQLFVKGKLMYDQVYLPTVENITKYKPGDKGFMVKWDIEKNAKITLDWYLVQHSYPFLNKWVNSTVEEKHAFINSLCDVEVRIAVYCIFGICGDDSKIFRGINNGDISCNEDRMKALKKKQELARKMARKAMEGEFNKTRIVIPGGENKDNQPIPEKNIVIYHANSKTTGAPAMQLSHGRSGHFAAVFSSGKILLGGGYMETQTDQKGKRENKRDQVWKGMDMKTSSLQARRKIKKPSLQDKELKFEQEQKKRNKSSQNNLQKTNSVATSKTELLDIDLLNSKETKPMSKGRSFAAVTVHSDRVFVCGGHTGNYKVPHEDCEVFADGIWDYGWNMNMSMSRSFFGLVTTDDDELFAIGGLTSNGFASRVVEKYSLKTHTWKHMPLLNQGRYNFGYAFLKGFIYVCGGNTGPYNSGDDKTLTTCERFNTTKKVMEQKWGYMVPMSMPRQSFNMLPLIDDRIYALGGSYINSKKDTVYVRGVDVYDPYRDKWTIDGQLSVYRINGPAVVVGEIFL